MTVRVALTGRGKLGAFIAEVVGSVADHEVVAQLGASDDLHGILGADLLIDATTPAASPGIVEFAAAHGIHSIVGTSGWTAERIDALRRTITGNLAVGVTIIPNFSLGSTLGTAFARLAARYYESIEIVEAHPAAKIDSPSGTAIRTAELMASARQGLPVVAAPHTDQRARGQAIAGIPVHSIRLRGLVAQQEVLFGGDGEVLSVRHDTFGNEAYRAGILATLDYARRARGVTVGLDSVLGIDTLFAPPAGPGDTTAPSA